VLTLLPVAAAVFVLAPDWRPDVFSATQAIYLAPFFLSGLAARILGAEERLAGGPALALLAFAAALLVLHALAVFGALAMDTHRQTAFGLLLSLSAVLGLIAVRPSVGWLAAIGGYSYAIYLFHVFFTAGMRTATNALVPGLPLPVVFTLSLLAGVLLPIVVEKVVSPFRLPALFLLGVDRTRRVRAAEPRPA
jgi:peptidoglycan/LPS O-acetylase OafA/YrhL